MSKQGQTMAEYLIETLSDSVTESKRRLARCHVQNEKHFKLAITHYSRAINHLKSAFIAERKGIDSERDLTGMEDV